MKKLLRLVLCMILPLTLVACSSSEEPKDDAKTEEVSKKEEKVEFEAEDIIDNDQCKVTVKSIDPKGFWGYTLSLVLENKSDTTNYMFSVDYASINGVKVDALFAETVATGKKSNEDLTFPISELKDLGLGDVTDIEIKFRVHDSDDWTAENIIEEVVHVYPYGEDKATTYTRASTDKDVVIGEGNGIKVTYTGVGKDSLLGQSLQLYIENTTNKEIMVSIDDCSVNGYMCDPFFATSVGPHNVAYATLSWLDSQLEDNDITEIEEVEANLRVHDYNDWFSDDYLNNTFKIQP